MKKIALIVTSLKSGGLERNASILANHFAKKGHKVFICCLKNNTTFFKLHEEVKVIDMATNKNKLISFNIWKKKLHNFFKVNNINTVISFGDRTGVLSAKAIQGLEINHICRGINTKKQITNKLLLSATAKNIDCFVFQTNAQQNNYPKAIRIKGINIPNPFELYQENLNVEGVMSKRFVTVASFKIKQKRQDLMIKAFKIFAKRHPDFTFEMYGSYEEKQKKIIDKLIEKEGLVGKVLLMGENTNIKNAIVPSRAFICASRHEGMPNALIEALSYGIPVLSTMWKGADEILENGVNALTSNIGDVEALANNMSLIADDDKLYKKLSENSYRHIIKNFEKDHILKIWEKII